MPDTGVSPALGKGPSDSQMATTVAAKKNTIGDRTSWARRSRILGDTASSRPNTATNWNSSRSGVVARMRRPITLTSNPPRMTALISARNWVTLAISRMTLTMRNARSLGRYGESAGDAPAITTKSAMSARIHGTNPRNVSPSGWGRKRSTSPYSRTFSDAVTYDQTLAENPMTSPRGRSRRNCCWASRYGNKNGSARTNVPNAAAVKWDQVRAERKVPDVHIRCRTNPGTNGAKYNR